MLTLAMINQLFGASARAIRKVALATVAVASRLSRKLAHRAQLRELAQFDDHMLHDIGLSRSDVAGALETGIFSVSTPALGARDTARQGLVRQHLRASDRSGAVDVKAVKVSHC